MKRITWSLLVVIFVAAQAPARQAVEQVQHNQAKHLKGPPSSAGIVTEPACKELKALGDSFDQLFAGPTDPALSAAQGAAQSEPRNSSASLKTDIDQDRTWQVLMSCANQSRSESERADALRIAAMWEHVRAQNFAEKYRLMRPVKSPQCANLDTLGGKVDLAVKNNDEISSDEVSSVTRNLLDCAEDSERLNNRQDQSEALIARTRVFQWTQLANSKRLAEFQFEAKKEQPEVVAQKQTESNEAPKQARPATSTAPVSVRVDGNIAGGKFGEAAERNPALCDQVITVARITPNGLEPESGAPGGRKFLAKKHPRMCLIEGTARATPGIPRYLLVYARSERAFAGFQPTQQTASSHVSGLGTASSPSGGMWNFTYFENAQTTQTVQEPYVVNSRSLFLYAYDANGKIVSHHSLTFSTQSGGNPWGEAGYNTGALISLIWKNPRRLAEKVLKDVQTDSMKYRSGANQQN